MIILRQAIVGRIKQPVIAWDDVRAIDIATDFHDFDDYWAAFLGGQAPTPSYAMSLSEDQRAALRERLRQAERQTVGSG